jgi:lauroyl/myristoyl acyltransferase
MILVPELSQISKLAALTVVAWTTPPSYWRYLAELRLSRVRGESDPCRHVWRRALGISDDETLLALGAKRRSALRESKIQVMGLAGPWRGWRPKVRLRGEEHLLAALQRGKGVILWASSFNYSHLIFKMALQQAGHRATQLSRPAHGFGNARIAVRLLNPIWMGVEERFLKERVLIQGEDTAAAVKRLRGRLAENGIVIITVGNEARHTVGVPFLGHRLRLAVGPASIARSSGAALLPGFAVRNGDGAFEVTIEAPLEVPPAGSDHARLGEVAADLARRLEPYARRYPEQWSGWNELMAEGAPQAAGTAAAADGPRTARA